ncbi:MAG: transcriptional repressor LexA [bacterium]
MTEKLTLRQKEVLDFILERLHILGSPPTIREIARHFGFSSTGSPRVHLRALARKGYLRLNPQISRGIEVLAQAVGIPIVGRVKAGGPDLAVEDVEGYLDLSRVFPHEENIFALRVKGDSMVGAGIMDGDLAIVRRQPSAEEGEIVVALIGEEATVKCFFKESQGVRLEPANPSYEPILSKEAIIVGKVIGLIRGYK